MGPPLGSFATTRQNDATRLCIADWLGVDLRDNTVSEVQTGSQFLVARYPIPR